jgi:EmrB/QacA subfamily drug resistance transporter
MRKTNRPLTVVALMLSLFMAALEATVVATAMPTVVGDLGGIHIYSWVFTAYLLTSTVAVPIYGKLADLYGRKPVLLFGIALFLFGSIASGESGSMTQLIVFRAIQGLGAGSMQPMALTIVGDIFNIEERGKMQGFFGSVWAVAGLIGPMLGGLIVQHLSWPWIFFINVPFGFAAMALIVFALHERVERKPHGLDIAGAALLMAGVTALLVGTSGGGTALYGFAAAAVLLMLFGYVETRAAEPVLPFPIFRRPVIAVSSLAGALIGGSMFATMSYVPLFAQGVMGVSPTEAGSAMTPMLIGWPAASAVAGRLLKRVGYRPLIRVGLGLTALSAILLAVFALSVKSLWLFWVLMLFFGIGLGFANMALLIAVQTSVDWEQRGIVTASTMFFRTIGGMIALGVTGGVLRVALSRDASIPEDAASQLLGPEHGHSLSPEILKLLGAALERGVGQIFWIIGGVASAAFLAALLFPDVAVRDSMVPPVSAGGPISGGVPSSRASPPPPPPSIIE